MLLSILISAFRKRNRTYSWSPALDLSDPNVRCALMGSSLS